MEFNCMMGSDELRQKAAHFRLIAMDGEDMHLVAALRQLAEEYDAEAGIAGEQNTSPKDLKLHHGSVDRPNHSD
jgi:hypothetical protein